MPEPVKSRRGEIGLVIAGLVLAVLLTTWLMLPQIAGLGMKLEATQPYAAKLILWLDMRAFRQLFYYHGIDLGLSRSFYRRCKLAETDSEFRGGLLRALGNCDFQDIGGRMMLHYAAVLGYPNLATELLELGANPDGADAEDSPLLLAISFRQTQSVGILLENGANPNRVRGFGDTYLHEAVMKGDTDVVELLLKHGADVEVKDEDGRNPLNYARDVKMAALLLEHGANINARSMSGRTMLDREEPGSEMAKFLREHGAKTGAELDEERAKTPEQEKSRAGEQ